jgi:hypothetical protein
VILTGQVRKFGWRAAKPTFVSGVEAGRRAQMALLLETLGTWLALNFVMPALIILTAFCSNKKRVDQSA